MGKASAGAAAGGITAELLLFELSYGASSWGATSGAAGKGLDICISTAGSAIYIFASGSDGLYLILLLSIYGEASEYASSIEFG